MEQVESPVATLAVFDQDNMAAIGNLSRSDKFALFSDYSFINFC